RSPGKTSQPIHRCISWAALFWQALASIGSWFVLAYFPNLYLADAALLAQRSNVVVMRYAWSFPRHCRHECHSYRHKRSRLAATSVVVPLFFTGRLVRWLRSCQFRRSNESVMLFGMNRLRDP